MKPAEMRPQTDYAMGQGAERWDAFVPSHLSGRIATSNGRAGMPTMRRASDGGQSPAALRAGFQGAHVVMGG